MEIRHAACAMKLFTTIFIALLPAFALYVYSQPPTTSDISKSPSFRIIEPIIVPGREPKYVAPYNSVCVRFYTNIRPLVVEQTIWSNVCMDVIWHDDGVLRTNTMLISTNFISRTTISL